MRVIERRVGGRIAVLACALAAIVAAPVRAESAPINKMCPVLTDEEADPAITCEYAGHTIGFCCKRCLTKFQDHPEKYLANLNLPVAETGPAGAGGPAGGALPAEGEAAEEHEHEATGAIAWLGKFHPLVVHFPIAMLLGAALAEILLMAGGSARLADAARFCLWFGVLSAVVAAVLGWFWAGFALTDSRDLMTAHRWVGTGTALWSLLVLILAPRAAAETDPPARRGLYRATLFVGAIAVSVAGFLGGALVYGIDHLV
ncbi:MAG TPA: YHS domain-containing protein [Phycisphaerae bacterium]|nr:YHS domain-containing protein [Phycisphaerales bacterium]HRX86660.1 YHS domain-containing protein [Phycisphaerae bacterium]